MSDETWTVGQAFTEVLRQDLESGRDRSLAEYLALFPEREVDVAAAFLAMKGRAADARPERGTGRRTTGAGGGETVGPFRIVKELGRGGQGIVFLAEDTRLPRRVALKVLTAVGTVPPEVLARFRREAEVASKLDHPGICAVYETGSHEGVPWIAMRFVEGETLRDRIAREISAQAGATDVIVDLAATAGPREVKAGPSPGAAHSITPGRESVHALLVLFEKAARALHAAHEAGVIHRDVKPHNIMVTPVEEPVILDFGLARDLESDQPTLTASGELFGTPAYMSPEQVGAHSALDRRTDVWSLAVALYEALTLRRPFDAATREQLYQAILGQDPPDPRKRNPAVGNDLRVVLDTALEKDRDRRYQSAAAFADDLARVRRLEPILARPAGLWVRFRRWCQRNPALATAVGGLALLAVVGAALLSYGVGASQKADLEARLRRFETVVRERAEAEAASLQQREVDRAFRRRLSGLTIAIGCLKALAKGEMDVCPVTKESIVAYREYGIPLDGDEDPGEVAAALDALTARDNEQGRSVLDGIYDIGSLLEVAGVSRAADLQRGVVPAWAKPEDIQDWKLYLEVEPWLVGIWGRITAILDAAESSIFRRDVWETAKQTHAEREDQFLRFLADDALAGRSAEELAWLAGRVAVARWSHSGTVKRIIDRALQLRPGSFDLHFTRGCLSFSAIPQALDLDGYAGSVFEATEHLRVSVALRPESALVRGMYGLALAYGEDRGEARRCLEECVRLGPEEALAWFMLGRFLAEEPEPAERARAKAAFEKAIALDEKLQPARAALTALETR